MPIQPGIQKLFTAFGFISGFAMVVFSNSVLFTEVRKLLLFNFLRLKCQISIFISCFVDQCHHATYWPLVEANDSLWAVLVDYFLVELFWGLVCMLLFIIFLQSDDSLLIVSNVTFDKGGGAGSRRWCAGPGPAGAAVAANGRQACSGGRGVFRLGAHIHLRNCCKLVRFWLTVFLSIPCAWLLICCTSCVCL